MATRFLIFILLLTTFNLSSQSTLTKDSFFLSKKPFPKNYKSLIADNKWLYLGYYRSWNNRIYLADTIKLQRIVLFERDGSYRKIKGHKIITNSDLSTEKIIYIDDSTLILESAEKKGFNRRLFRRKP